MSDKTLEQLFKAGQRGPITLIRQTNQEPYFGRATIGSGQVTATIATTYAASNSVIHLAMQAATAVGSGAAAVVEVRSINPGVGFVVGFQDGAARAPVAETTVMWELKRSDAA